MIETVLWDWNGTLLDDVPLALRANEEMCALHGWQAPTTEEYRRKFRFPVQDYYRDLGVRDDQFETVAAEWMAAYVRHFSGTPLHAGAVETVERLNAAGLRQVIISATREDMLLTQVAAYPPLAGRFFRVCGTQDIYAKSKVERALDVLAEVGESGENAVFIGDTDHDALVAKAIGCPCLLVRGGHQNESILKKTDAQIMDSLSDAASWILERSRL